MKPITLLSLAALATASSLSQARAAAIVITEVMSSGNFSGLTNDWFELTNTGAATISGLTNYKMDDNSFGLATAVSLLGVSSIAPGESIIFIESSAPASDIAAFRSFWGGAALAAQIGTYTGTGVGLSSTADGVVIYDGTGTEVNRVTFGAATPNTSFGYNQALYPSQSGFGPVSVAGQNGAFTSAGSPANFGSPGAIPEPTSVVLLASAAGFLLRARLRRGLPGLS